MESSARARRLRSSASARSAPETISLAMRESKLPSTTSPTSTPESRRTPGPSGTASAVITPGVGTKPRAGVLGVDAELEGVAVRSGVLAERQRLAGGDPEHLPDQVDPRGLLGDRVLDLEPGVHLEERQGAVAADEVLHGPSADVAGLAADRDGRLPYAAELLWVPGTARGPPRRASGAVAVASSRGFPQRRPCRADRRGPGPRRAGADPGSARRSTPPARMPRRPRAPPTRRAPGSPHGTGRPSARGRRRRTRP